MKKKKFNPNTITKHLDEDYGLGQDITVELWKDPSRKVVVDMLEILGTPTSDLDKADDDKRTQLDDRYFECATLVFIDCDVEGIDFETVESTRAAFDAEFLPWGIFHQTLLMYMSELIDEYGILKNVLRRVSEKPTPPEEASNSGNENETVEDTSAT